MGKRSSILEISQPLGKFLTFPHSPRARPELCSEGPCCGNGGGGHLPKLSLLLPGRSLPKLSSGHLSPAGGLEAQWTCPGRRQVGWLLSPFQQSLGPNLGVAEPGKCPGLWGRSMLLLAHAATFSSGAAAGSFAQQSLCRRRGFLGGWQPEAGMSFACKGYPGRESKLCFLHQLTGTPPSLVYRIPGYQAHQHSVVGGAKGRQSSGKRVT